MPLFGKKLGSKDSRKEDSATVPTVAAAALDASLATNEYGPVPPPKADAVPSQETSASALQTVYDASLMSGVHANTYAYSYPSYADAVYQYMEAPTPGGVPPVAVVAPVSAVVDAEPLQPPGEKDVANGTASGRAGLPDDLQHALDLIYHGGTGPKVVTFPPQDGQAEAVQTEEYNGNELLKTKSLE